MTIRQVHLQNVLELQCQ